MRRIAFVIALLSFLLVAASPYQEPLPDGPNIFLPLIQKCSNTLEIILVEPCPFNQYCNLGNIYVRTRFSPEWPDDWIWRREGSVHFIYGETIFWPGDFSFNYDVMSALIWLPVNDPQPLRAVATFQSGCTAVSAPYVYP